MNPSLASSGSERASWSPVSRMAPAITGRRVRLTTAATRVCGLVRRQRRVGGRLHGDTNRRRSPSPTPRRARTAGTRIPGHRHCRRRATRRAASPARRPAPSTAPPRPSRAVRPVHRLRVSGQGTHPVSCSISRQRRQQRTGNDTVKIDTVNPTSSSATPPNGVERLEHELPVTVTVATSDGVSGLAGAPTCTVDGSPAMVTGTGPYSVSVTGDGTHPVSCLVSDLAGNSNAGNDSVKIDTVNPTITVSHTSTGTNGWNTASPVTVKSRSATRRAALRHADVHRRQLSGHRPR